VVVLVVVAALLAGCGSAGANPLAWVGVFCGGLADVIAGQSQAAVAQPTPQRRKDGMIKLADTTEQAFTNAAHKLVQLGSPDVTGGTKAQVSAVGFFTAVAAAVGDRRAKLAALDANDPDFMQKADQLSRPDLGAAAAQVQGLTTNQQLTAAFSAAPECQRLSAPHQ
jgi:hypothetical protein